VIQFRPLQAKLLWGFIDDNALGTQVIEKGPNILARQ
jgi:hypothetical protein